MKVLFLGPGQDNSNSGYSMMMAAKVVGCEVRGYCESKHPFRYPNQLSADMPHTEESFNREIRWADIIHYYRSLLPHRILDRVPSKPTVAQHGDDSLRKDPGIASMFNHLPHAHICETADLTPRIEGKSYLIPSPVDVETLRPSAREGRIRIGHFPSEERNKGTSHIKAAIGKLKKKFDFEWVSGRILSWGKNIERMRELDIYIDQCSVNLPRRCDIGEWGVSTREAAAMGVLPITSSFNLMAYRKEYGEHGFVVANSSDEIYITLAGLLSIGREQLREYQDKARKWVVRNHSYEVTGRRLVEIYTKLLKEA